MAFQLIEAVVPVPLQEPDKPVGVGNQSMYVCAFADLADINKPVKITAEKIIINLYLLDIVFQNSKVKNQNVIKKLNSIGLFFTLQSQNACTQDFRDLFNFL